MHLQGVLRCLLRVAVSRQPRLFPAIWETPGKTLAQLVHQQGLLHLSLLGGWWIVLAMWYSQARVVKILAALLAPLLQSAEILQNGGYVSVHFERSTCSVIHSDTTAKGV